MVEKFVTVRVAPGGHVWARGQEFSPMRYPNIHLNQGRLQVVNTSKQEVELGNWRPTADGKGREAGKYHLKAPGVYFFDSISGELLNPGDPLNKALEFGYLNEDSAVHQALVAVGINPYQALSNFGPSGPFQLPEGQKVLTWQDYLKQGEGGLEEVWAKRTGVHTKTVNLDVGLKNHCHLKNLWLTNSNGQPLGQTNPGFAIFYDEAGKITRVILAGGVNLTEAADVILKVHFGSWMSWKMLWAPVCIETAREAISSLRIDCDEHDGRYLYVRSENSDVRFRFSPVDGIRQQLFESPLNRIAIVWGADIVPESPAQTSYREIMTRSDSPRPWRDALAQYPGLVGFDLQILERPRQRVILGLPGPRDPDRGLKSIIASVGWESVAVQLLGTLPVSHRFNGLHPLAKWLEDGATASHKKDEGKEGWSITPRFDGRPGVSQLLPRNESLRRISLRNMLSHMAPLTGILREMDNPHEILDHPSARFAAALRDGDEAICFTDPESATYALIALAPGETGYYVFLIRVHNTNPRFNYADYRYGVWGVQITNTGSGLEYAPYDNRALYGQVTFNIGKDIVALEPHCYQIGTRPLRFGFSSTPEGIAFQSNATSPC